jgi:hypothetical protein
MWSDRDLDEQSVYDHNKENGYDHNKENGGALVGVPSMEEMESDEVANIMNSAENIGGVVGGHPIYSGLHELTSSGASAATSSSHHHLQHDPSSAGTTSLHHHLQHDPSNNSLMMGNGGPSVLDPHSHPTLAMDHHHLHHMHHHQVTIQKLKCI